MDESPYHILVVTLLMCMTTIIIETAYMYPTRITAAETLSTLIVFILKFTIPVITFANKKYPN